MRSFQYDPKLDEWATPSQKKYLDAVRQYGSIRAASRELKCNYTTVHGCIESVLKKAAKHGYAPNYGMLHPVPSPYVVKGTSTLYDADGQIRAQWVKSKLDKEQAQQAIRDFIESLSKDIKGLAAVGPAPKISNADLLAVYPIGDPHFGMYAWAAEAGEDFDTDIAERITCSAIDRLIQSAPDAETAILLELGDMFHADNSSNATPTNKNALDVDTRWARVIRIGLRALQYCIKRLAEKHKKVIVRIVPGNHDPHSSFALALALDAYFHGHDRITIDLSPAIHWYYHFGQVLIGSTHGDTVHMKDLSGNMAADRPEEWGKSRHRYWYCGHVHHKEIREFHTVLVEYFRTLAPRDAWATGKGYRAGRDMYCIVHHKEHGEVERHRCDIGMLA